MAGRHMSVKRQANSRANPNAIIAKIAIESGLAWIPTWHGHWPETMACWFKRNKSSRRLFSPRNADSS